MSTEYMNTCVGVENATRMLQCSSEPKLATVSHASLSTSDLGHRYLCGLLRLSSAYFIVLTIELLAIVQMVLFTFVNYLHGFERYYELNAEIGKIIHFSYLLPLLIFQVIWFFSIVASFASVPTVFPYLMLPHVFLSVISLLAAIVLVVLTVCYTVREARLEWPIILLIILPNIFILAELYCIYITFACFRWLVHKKKSVRATGPDKAAQIDVVGSLDSYSRRSTAIVNDDYLYIPT